MRCAAMRTCEVLRAQWDCKDGRPPFAPSRPAPVAEWKSLSGRGRGVVATADILPGTLIDMAPAVPVGADDHELKPYHFMTERGTCLELPGSTSENAIVFGLMSLCNHSDTPNGRVCFCHAGERGLEAYLVASCAVRSGDEITIDYRDSDWYRDRGHF